MKRSRSKMSKFLLPFGEGQRPRRIFSPAAVLLSTLALAVLTTVQTEPLVVASVICAILVVGTVVRTRWRTVFSLALRFEVIILIWLLLEPVLYGSTVLFTIATPLGSLNVYAEGVRMGTLLALRMFALLLLFLTGLSHLTLAEFVDALRTLHVPAIMIGSLLVMLRYIPLFIEERDRLHEAQILRGFQRGSRWERITSLGYLVGSTIDRALDRSMTVYEAMLLRGFSSHSSLAGSGFRRWDTGLVACLIAIALGMSYLLPSLLDVVVPWMLRLL